MATSHLKNCLPFMRRNARNLVHTDADGWWNFAMYLQGEMAIDATESNAMQAERMAEEGSDAECVRWVRESGAYRAMVNELWERRCLLRSGIQRLDLVPK
jgi:hypothetical protein